jgi:enoyl-CoA hydratase
LSTVDEEKEPVKSETAAGSIAAEGAADGVRVELRDAIAEVVLERPHVHNALSLDMWKRLRSVFQALSGMPELRVVIVKGAGDRAFSAGADISEFRRVRLGPAAHSYNDAIAGALEAIRDTPVPVIAMIGGLAVGGGCEIATVCDLRIASQRAKFGIPIMRLGVTLGKVEAAALVGLVGPGHAKDLLLTGRMIDADEALRIGLVNRVVPPADLERVTWETARHVGSGAPLPAKVNKLTINGLVYGLSPNEETRLQQLADDVYDGSDLKEGIAAFEERRDPMFTGR